MAGQLQAELLTGELKFWILTGAVAFLLAQLHYWTFLVAFAVQLHEKLFWHTGGGRTIGGTQHVQFCADTLTDTLVMLTLRTVLGAVQVHKDAFTTFVTVRFLFPVAVH